MEMQNKETFVTRRRGRSHNNPKPAQPQDRQPQKEGNGVLPTLLWTANQLLVAVTPVLFVYGTVLPLLADTVPLVASKVSASLTVPLQLLVVVWLSVTAWDFYSLQVYIYQHYHRVYTKGHYNKWAHKGGLEDLLKATRCEQCNVYLIRWRYHSRILNACVCWGDWYAAALNNLLIQLKRDNVALFLVYLLEAVLGGPVRLSLMLQFAMTAVAITCYSPTPRAGFYQLAS